MAAESGPPGYRRADGVRRLSGGRCTAVARDDRFRLLKTRHSRVAALIAVSFLGWYLLYVLLAAFARDFMARPVFGNVNMALLLGLLQFVSTFLIAGLHALYARYALDPLVEEIRAEAEGDPARWPATAVQERPVPAQRRPISDQEGPVSAQGRPVPTQEHPGLVQERSGPTPEGPGPAQERPMPGPDAGYAPGTAGRAGRRQGPASGLRRDQVSGAWTDLGRDPAHDTGPGGSSLRRPDLGTR
jgi:uncharacterized membrane protein (DUF485 family)